MKYNQKDLEEQINFIDMIFTQHPRDKKLYPELLQLKSLYSIQLKKLRLQQSHNV